MGKFLGLSLFPEPLSDSEYVEQVRRDLLRNQRYGKWLTMFWMTLFVVWTGFLIWIIIIGMGLLGNQNPFALGVTFGICIGGAMAVPIVEILRQVFSSYTALRDSRASELLVKYHDALLQLGQADCENAT